MVVPTCCCVAERLAVMVAILGRGGAGGRMGTGGASGRPLRTVFFGTPAFAAPILHALAAGPAFDMRLVVTQGGKDASPVAAAAAEVGLPVYTPVSLRDSEARRPLADCDADVFVVAAFGLIFRQGTLDIRLGCVNVHPSLLPQYRGATPVMAAIEEGDVETGVSLMVMDAGIDTGAVISVMRTPVDPTDTTESLGARLAGIGATQAVRDIPRWARGELVAQPQAQEGASLTRTLSKADGWIDWSRGATEIERQVRAMWPWPRAWTTAGSTSLQVHKVEITDMAHASDPGMVLSGKKQLTVACGDGALELLTVEPAGRRVMSAKAFLNGLRQPLTRLGDVGGPPPQRPLIVPIGAYLAG